MTFTPSKIAIQRPASIFILMVLIFFMGVNAYKSLPREDAPDIQIPLLIITVPYPGASPADVEALVINKLEKELQNLEYLKEMKSTSTEGAAIITLEFSLDFKVSAALTKVREAIDRVKPDLPAETEDPIITEINLSEEPIMIVNIAGKMGLHTLKKIAEDIKDEIKGIQGVLDVKRAGGLEKEVQVFINPNKLRHYNLDLNQVALAITQENTSVPGGKMKMGPMNYLIRVPSEIVTPSELENIPIKSLNKVPIYIRDIAKVQFGFKELESRSRLNGIESVSLSISKRSGENLIEISKKIKAIVAKEEKRFGKKLKFTILSDKSKKVNQMVSDLENNIFSGLTFVFIVLLITMGPRSAFFVGAAIPFSMLISFIVIQWLSITLNVVVLFSLILALGMLVDNAIVVVENIYRHMESGKSRVEASLVGVGEVAIPIISSTITTLAAFLPLIFMPGIMGEFMSYLPKTLIITLTASLFVGLIINPVLCATLMPQPKEKKALNEFELAKKSKWARGYRKVLEFALKYSKSTMIIVILVWVFVIFSYFKFVFPKQGVEFFPTTQPQEAVVHIKAPLGTTLEKSDAIVKELEKALKPFQKYTDAIVGNVGQGRGSQQSVSSISHIVIAFPDWQEWKGLKPSEVVAKARKRIKHIVGAEISVKKAQMGPPRKAPVRIEISGNDFNIMKDISIKIQQKIKNTKGIVNLKDDFDKSRAEIRVVLDREKISQLGLRASQIGGLIRTAFNGKKVSTYREGKEEYDIIVRLDQKFRTSSTSLESFHIKTASGRQVPISELARVIPAPSFGSIRHVGSKRVITISADSEGVPGPVLLKAVQKKLKGMKTPSGYFIKYTGSNKAEKESQDFLAQSFLVALFLIFLVLVTQFNSIVLPFIILTSVVLSLMGVFLGMIIHARPISIMMGGIGTISLAGVVVNNSIVLIDYINQLRERGESAYQAILIAGMVRLRPVLLTAVTTILGLIPITLGMDINFYRWPNVVVFGSEGGTFWVPMAYAVIYGLGVATVLTLIVVPVLYLQVESIKKTVPLWFNKALQYAYSLQKKGNLPASIHFRRQTTQNGQRIDKIAINELEELPPTDDSKINPPSVKEPTIEKADT
ncbi:MAG: multidrug efflux pump [bacterium]|jgi:multidrug efflux pump